MKRVSRPTFSKSLEDPDNPVSQLNCLFTLCNETLHLIYYFFFFQVPLKHSPRRTKFGPTLVQNQISINFTVLKSYRMCSLTTTELNRNRYPPRYLKKSKYPKIARFWRCSHSEWLRSQRWHDEGNVKLLWEEWEQKDDLTLILPYSKLICLK